jgi:hypothetical protein
MNNETRKNIEGAIFLILFCLTVPAANWMLGHVGTVCPPNSPCLVPVAPGLMAPSGVLLIAIIAGASISAALSPASLVLASAAAFMISELTDFAIYTPLARRRLVLAVVTSSLVGLVVDSIVFLWLAFGSLDFLMGQIVGKFWMVLLAIPLVTYIRRRDERLGLTPA